MSQPRQLVALTPCAGRCSTVFGDLVCRGCRRYNHEVIAWNGYDEAQQNSVWQRLDAQLDQILLPLLPRYNLAQVQLFLHTKRLRTMPQASKGRMCYHALKICEKMPHLAPESGLGLLPEQIQPLWQEFERRVLALAQASYDFAWLRADSMRSIHTQQLLDDDDN